MEKEKILPIFLFFVLLSLVLIFAGNVGLTRPVQSAFEITTNPLRTGFYRAWQGVNSSLSALGTLRSGPKRISELESQVRELESLRVKLRTLEEENSALRKQLEAPLPATFKFLPAKTLAKTRYLTIDKGEDDGVRQGMIVISEDIFVGKVIKTAAKTSQVLLPSDPDSKIPVQTFKTQAHGLVIGEFGTRTVLDKVLQAEVLAVGDLVVTSGEAEYPRNLIVGKIEKIEKAEVQPFQKAKLAPLLDYGKLIDVFVIK